MADELACDTCPQSGPLHEILGAHGASLLALQREVDHLREDFREDLRDQDGRLIAQIDEKFGLKLAVCEGHEERIHTLEIDRARRSGAGITHGRYLGIVQALFMAVIGGVAGALGTHFMPSSH